MQFFRYCFFIFALLFVYISIQAQANLNHLGVLPYTHAFNEDLSNLWGYSAGGRDYAVVGTTHGVSVVDVTNGASPVEVFWSPANQFTYWREVKTFGTYAYIVNEAQDGLEIINLSDLPNGTISPSDVTHWTGGTWAGNNISVNTAHTIFIDGNGIGYIFGADYGNGGCIMVNFAANPTNPPIVGIYNQRYIHDGFVRNDTLWAAHINDGIFSVINVTNKANPVTLATQASSGSFTHNIWLSDDSNYAFTTDEETQAFLDAYDVSNLNDIKLVGQYRTTNIATIIHNVHIKNNTAVIAYYRDGVVAVDVTHPEKMVEVGRYDTSPNYSGNGFNGCWGVYPFFASGKLIAADIETGLHVFSPNYVQATFLKGVITNASTGQPIQGASITIAQNSALNVSSGFSGDYITASTVGGTYTVTVAKAGFASQTFTIVLNNGITQTLNVQLIADTPFVLTGIVTDSIANAPLSGAKVLVKEVTTGNTYTGTTIGNGMYSINLPGGGLYDVFAGKWSYRTKQTLGITLGGIANTVNIALGRGLYDDFLLDLGWTVSGNAQTGAWVRETPFGTTSNSLVINPYTDVTGDMGAQCYVTGNSQSSVAGDGDVDNGSTILTSPVFNFSGNGNPQISYYRWFRNSGGNSTPDDQMLVKLSNGTTTVVIETISDGDAFEGQWRQTIIRVADFITPTNTMQLIVDIGDTGSQHLVEGGLDLFEVSELPAQFRISAKVILNGAYSSTLNAMRTDLKDDGLLPLNQPYSGTPWNYAGTEQVANASQIPANVVDWVLVEVRRASNNALIERRAGFVRNDGILVDTDGQEGFRLYNVNGTDTYYFIIRHRNHLAIMSDSPNDLPLATPYDFTLVANVLGISSQVSVAAPGKYGMIAGDNNANGIINVADFRIYNSNTSITNQYHIADCNLDGNVDSNDFTKARAAFGRVGLPTIRY